MTEKRHFSGKRLYTLAKWVVIIVTTLAILGAVLTSHIMSQPYPCSQYEGGSPNSAQSRKWDSCVAFYSAFDDDQQKLFQQELAIIFFLPLTFFGGVGIYKFIFPYKKS